jgi:hypothetical protein
MSRRTELTLIVILVVSQYLVSTAFGTKCDPHCIKNGCRRQGQGKCDRTCVSPNIYRLHKHRCVPRTAIVTTTTRSAASVATTAGTSSTTATTQSTTGTNVETTTAGCTYVWTPYADHYAVTHDMLPGRTLSDCQRDCIARPLCKGIDWNAFGGSACYMEKAGDQISSYTGAIHYYLTRNGGTGC